MDSRLLKAMQDEAKRVYPQEACGVVVADGKRPVLVGCTNVAEDPNDFFVISPVEYAKAGKVGDIIAIWHSHPERTSDPSGADVAGCESTALDWIIVGLKKQDDEFVFEEPKTIKPTGIETPYVGRPYIVGAYDCYSLVRDYYAREFGIELNYYLHTEKWWEEGKNMFVDNFKVEGFITLINEEPQVGDCFLLQCGSSVPNHAVIYLGDDKILHHCYDRLSRIDIYGGGYWYKHTTHHLRHKSKC